MFIVQWFLLALLVLFDEGKEERAKRKKNTMSAEEERLWLQDRKREREKAERDYNAWMERKRKGDDQAWVAKQKQKREDLQRRRAMEGK